MWHLIDIFGWVFSWCSMKSQQTGRFPFINVLYNLHMWSTLYTSVNQVVLLHLSTTHAHAIATRIAHRSVNYFHLSWGSPHASGGPAAASWPSSIYYDTVAVLPSFSPSFFFSGPFLLPSNPKPGLPTSYKFLEPPKLFPEFPLASMNSSVFYFFASQYAE